MMDIIKAELKKTQGMVDKILSQDACMSMLVQIVEVCLASLTKGGKLLFIGNGGSAADAQHLAAELVCRFRQNRRALAAIALTTDTSALTAISNDYGYIDVFARQVEALGRAGDVLVAISTSGKSENVISALKQAKQQGIVCIGFTGENSGSMLSLCDHALQIPATDTAKIQEGHIICGHIICHLIEQEFIKKEKLLSGCSAKEAVL